MYTITTSTGNTIEITYTKDYIPGTPQFRVVVDGTVGATGATITTMGRPVEAQGKTIVAYLELKSGKGVGLTEEQEAALHAEADANRDSETRDRLAMDRLRSQRRSLVSTLNGIIADATPDDLYDSEYEHINLRRQQAAKEAEAKIPAAQAALDAFDHQHPEVLEAIKAEQAEMVDRNRWN